MDEKNELDRLVIENHGLVFYVINKYIKWKTGEYEDLVSIGTIGLVKAAKCFSEQKNIKFSTFAVKCILNEILGSKKENKKSIKYLLYNECMSRDKISSDSTFMEYMEDPRAEFISELDSNEEISIIVNYIINKLKTTDVVIDLYYLAGISQKEISQKTGLTRGYISNRFRGSIKKLRSVFGTENEVFRYTQNIFFEKYSNTYKVTFHDKDGMYKAVITEKLKGMSDDTRSLIRVYCKKGGDFIVYCKESYILFEFLADLFLELKQID